MKYLNSLLLALFFSFLFVTGVQAAETVELPMSDLIAQVVTLVTKFGGLSFYAKVSGVILILIASMQVSFMQPLWNKLGSAKAYVALGLALLAGVFQLDHITLAGVLAYLSAGAGALLVRQLLEILKAIPGIDSLWVTIFDLLASMLGGKSSEEIKAQKAAALVAKK